MFYKIAVLGGGSWGSALAKVLCENNHNVTMWVRNEEQCKELEIDRINKRYLPNVKLPENLKVTSNINEAAKNVDIIIISVPTQTIRNVLTLIQKENKTEKIIVNVSKGIEIKTLDRVSEIVCEETYNCKFAVLTGPSHAEEVGLCLPTAVTVASKDQNTANIIQNIFMTPYFRIYTNDDIIGAEMGGALKNIIALGAGISDGVGYGDNAKAALINRGIVEIARLGVAIGADIHTFYGLTGIGDLIVTCTSLHSRNRSAGYLIGQGYTKDEAIKKVGMVVEGITTTYAAYELAKKLKIEMPIVNAMYDILENGKDVKETVNELMLRDKKQEKCL